MNADPATEAPAEVTTEVVEAVVEEPKLGPADLQKFKSSVAAQFARLSAEPKERIRVPKAAGPQTVIINGARYDIAANVPVEVPATVAKLLRDMGRI